MYIGYTGSVTTTTTQTASGTAQGTVLVYTPLQTLSCDPYGYLIQYTTLSRVNITTGIAEKVRSPVGDGSRNIQAIGYNVADNFIYGSWYTALGADVGLIRIAGNGDSNIVTSLNITTWFPNSGDVDESSLFWATSQGNQWLQLDLKPGSATWGRTINNGTAVTPHLILDWAYVPNSGNYLWALGYDVKSTSLPDADNHVYLQRFERTTKVWSVVADLGKLAGTTYNKYGAVYATEDGYMFGTENLSGQTWKFNIPPNGDTTNWTPTPQYVATGNVSNSNDGARCLKAKLP
ncbi:hypothetical protein KJ359_009976 [Pestalotiopsis sp. 9143b]|nr:hypothetical protein KJ359_009976 [Pestalotiopsis sp. 9143b]